MRWFSSHYATPYRQVEEMPFEEVLRAFYEVEAEAAVAATTESDQAGHQARIELVKTLRELAMTPEERLKEMTSKQKTAAVLAEKDEEFDAKTEAEARAQEAAIAEAERKAQEGPQPPPPAEELPPIKMEFGQPHELDEIGSSDGLGGLVGLEKP